MNRGGNMTKMGRQPLIVSILLVAAGAYVLFLFFPIVAGTHTIGYGGRYSQNNFQVTKVFADSPAYQSGFRRGDVVVNQAGRPVKEWYQWYTSEADAYIKARAQLTEEPAVYTVLRGRMNLNFSYAREF